MHKGLLITHLNIRSLWSKIDLARTTFNSKDVDIITLSETWLTESITNEIIDFNGYTIYRKDRSWTEGISTMPKKGGGLCIYVKDELNVKTGHLNHLESSSIDVECQCLEILCTNQKNMIILNIYRPPQGKFDIFSEFLEQTINSIDQNRKDIFVLGDFNIDFIDKTDNNTKKLDRLISQLGLTKLISSPTRYGATKNSCIDQIITNATHIRTAGVDDMNISDHQLIYVVRKKNKNISTTMNFMGRSYRNYNENIFELSLNSKNWEQFDNNNDPEEMWKVMVTNLKDSIDEICPLRNFKIKRFKEPWITNELIEKIKDKDRAMKKAKQIKKR